MMQSVRTGTPTQPAHTLGNSARRHQYQLNATPSQLRHLARPISNGGRVKTLAISGQQSAAYFHNPSSGLLQILSCSHDFLVT
jgi:hypothetical protein